MRSLLDTWRGGRLNVREIVPVKRVKDVKTMITILSTLSQMLCTWRLVPKTDPNLRQEKNLTLRKNCGVQSIR